jgi:hypothetical protein
MGGGTCVCGRHRPRAASARARARRAATFSPHPTPTLPRARAVLKAIEVVKSGGGHVRDSSSVKAALDALLACGDDGDSGRADALSHHILRFAYCRTPDLQRWFLGQELELFKMRLERQTPEQLSAFMRANRLAFDVVPPGEYESLREALRAVMEAFPRDAEEREFDRLKYLKIPFTQALELVGTRGGGGGGGGGGMFGGGGGGAHRGTL